MVLYLERADLAMLICAIYTDLVEAHGLHLKMIQKLQLVQNTVAHLLMELAAIHILHLH